MSSNASPPSADARRTAIQGFFTQNRQAWLTRYDDASFDARNYRRRADVAFAMLGTLPKGNGRLLELGCGAGVQADRAQRLGWQVTATDFTLSFLQQAREKFAGPSWLAATAEDLPFAPGTFDVIMMLGVIGYVADPAVVLRGVQRLLAPGGHLIISWARTNTLMESTSRVVSAIPDRLYMAAKRAVRGASAQSAGNDPGFYVSYNRFWGRREFLRELTQAGFTPKEAQGVNFGRFRFMEHAIWPERVDSALSATLEGVAQVPGLGRLGHLTRTHVALAQRAGTSR